MNNPFLNSFITTVSEKRMNAFQPLICAMFLRSFRSPPISYSRSSLIIYDRRYGQRLDHAPFRYTYKARHVEERVMSGGSIEIQLKHCYLYL